MKIIEIILLICIAIGFYGGFAMALEYDEPIVINFWKRIRADFYLPGCILLCIIILPALIFCIFYEFFKFFVFGIVEVFFKIFSKDN